MRKKLAVSAIVVSLATFGVCSGSFAAVGNSRLPGVNESSQSFVIKDEQTFKDVLTAVPIMDSYITMGKDGQLYIDPKAEKAVSGKVLNIYQLGVDAINRAIKSGQLKPDPVRKTLVVQNTNSSISRGTVSPLSSVGAYWWGVAITMNHDEAADLAYSLSNYATGQGGVAGIAGLLVEFFGPVAWAASAGAVIMSVGNTVVANMINRNNEPAGCTLNIHWLPIGYISVNPN